MTNIFLLALHGFVLQVFWHLECVTGGLNISPRLKLDLRAAHSH